MPAEPSATVVRTEHHLRPLRAPPAPAWTCGNWAGSGHWPATTHTTIRTSRRSMPAIRARRMHGAVRSVARSSTARNRAGIAEVIASQQERRGAPPQARGRGRPTCGCQDGRGRHGPAGGRVWRAALHAAQSHHSHSARPPHGSGTGVSGRPDLLGGCRGSRLGRGRKLYGARCGAFSRAPSRLPLPEGAGELPVASLQLDSRIEPELDQLGASLSGTDFREAVMASLRDAYRPGRGMADAFARWLESVLGPYGLVVFDSSDPSAKPLARDIFTRELSNPGVRPRLPPLPARHCPREGISPRSRQTPTAFRYSG